MTQKRKEKKNQHYVPQCYLEAWAITDTHRVYVYDKKIKKSYCSNIEDVAMERYFYDIDFTGIVSESDLKKYGFEGYDPSRIDDAQYIENFFANQVEKHYKVMLNNIINRIKKMNSWEINNCRFITAEDKIVFSYYLAWQNIRVKSVRTSMKQSSNCLVQVLQEMGASDKTIKKYSISKEHLPYLHGGMILDFDMISEMAKSFSTLSWILLVNQADQFLFTSDNPIGTIGHVKHPFLSTAGLNSKGVEAFFPISYNLILLMFDGNYHTQFKNYDCRTIGLDDEELIKEYNRRCVLNSERCVFSKNDDFSIIENICNTAPNLLNLPRSVMHWGGKTFVPTD